MNEMHNNKEQVLLNIGTRFYSGEKDGNIIEITDGRCLMHGSFVREETFPFFELNDLDTEFFNIDSTEWENHVGTYTFSEMFNGKELTFKIRYSYKLEYSEDAAGSVEDGCFDDPIDIELDIKNFWYEPFEGTSTELDKDYVEQGMYDWIRKLKKIDY